MIVEVRIVTLWGKVANWEWITTELSRVLKMFFILLGSGYMGVHKNLKNHLYTQDLCTLFYIRLYLNKNLT